MNRVYKKFLTLGLALAILSGNAGFLSYKPQSAYAITKTATAAQVKFVIPEQLQKDIKTSIINVYGKEQSDQIYNNVLGIIEKAKATRSPELKAQDISRSSDWYKNDIVYMFYADQFGVKDKTNPNTFKNLIGMLDYLKDLGVTTIYILPYLDSPMGDAGFDVRNPKDVRKDLGGMKEFDQFLAEAKKRGLKIKSDLILNHFSDQHEWFQAALKGDKEKMNYFIYTDHPLKYKKYRDKQKGIVVDYLEDNGKVSSRRLMFPDICENNYRKVNIQGKDYYFYHTFYPFQLDINWENPKVLYEILNIISFWSNKGIDIFRVDAIPYFIKEKGTDAENLPKTHEIVKLLSSFIQAVGPRSVMQAEACQWPKDILPYFGEEHKINVSPDKQITRTNQVQIAYNFPLMPAMWASLITKNNNHFWNAYNNTPKIPSSSTWAMFLRVHDELTLEMVDINTRKLVYNKLVNKGAEFRKGLGVSGRMADFLDNDPKKIGLAFSILLSQPGLPIIYYGDEIGANNNWDYAKTSAKLREEVQRAKDKDIDVISFFDSRDINRGPVLKSDYYNVAKNTKNPKHKIYKTVKTMIKARKENVALTNGDFIKVNAIQPNVLSYLRNAKSEKVLVVNNLSGKTQKITLTLPESTAKDLKNKKSMVDVLTNKKPRALLKGNTLKIKVQPYQAMWLKF